MFNSLDNILQQECKLDRNLPILVGVSGGPDSICLLHCLIQAGYHTVVAHFNHQLRPEADIEAGMVLHLAEDWKIPAIVKEADVRSHAEQNHLSIEEAARELRYQFLFSTAGEQKAQAVAVGHNADDQVETILMHLLRGAGPAGLRGMRIRSLPNPWSKSIPLVRPLLAIWRTDIEAYLQEYQLPANRDASNLDPVYYRNQLRHQVIPYLQTLHPQIKKALWQTAELVGTDYDFLLAEIQAKWDSDIIRNKSRGVIEINRQAFLDLAESLQRGLLRRAAFELQPNLRDLDYSAIQRALHAIKLNGSELQVDLVSGIQLVVDSDRLWLVDQGSDIQTDEWPQISSATTILEELNLGTAREVQLENGWELHVEIVTCDEQVLSGALNNPDPYQAWADADRISEPLSLRTRMPGDQIQLLGMGGQHTNLSDLFINRKIPRRGRTKWPLIVSGNRILWVPGVQLAEPFRLTAVTQRAIHFSVIQRH
ncbi:MAG TPA: tRNA lysidine(34) synthetase TilS [Anaerolineales bacterium]|nr:tRNA lysidine(34) synthetase TilS [Anaerolineales bacterium]